MSLSIIVAMSKNRVIGKDNKLPWHIVEDLKRFKNITMGHAIIMGRKTFESIGRPLPGRENIVITRNRNFKAEGVKVVHSLELATMNRYEDEEIFVIGGAEIYQSALPKVQNLYITMIDQEFEGDTFFPELDFDKDFTKVEETEQLISEKNQLPYHFITLKRK